MNNWFEIDTIEQNYNEIHECWGKNFEYREIPLLINKNINIYRVYEVDYTEKIYFVRNEGVVINNIMVTSTFSDTIHFVEETNLFDTGNENNRFFTIVEQKGVKSLKLSIKNENIFISKSEARAIYKIYNLSRQGYTFNRVLENEYKFTVDQINKIIDL